MLARTPLLLALALMGCPPPPATTVTTPPPPPAGAITYALHLDTALIKPGTPITVTLSEMMRGCNKYYPLNQFAMNCPAPPPPRQEQFTVALPAAGQPIIIASEFLAPGNQVNISVQAQGRRDCDAVFGHATTVVTTAIDVTLELSVTHMTCQGAVF